VRNEEAKGCLLNTDAAAERRGATEERNDMAGKLLLLMLGKWVREKLL